MTNYNNECNRIVIIEDNDDLRHAYETIISSHSDFSVVGTFSDCETALKKISKDEPDLVLIDLTLPGMSGVVGIAKIRRLLPKVKVLVVTVHDDSEHVFDALCAGAIGYITKDVNANELMASIRQVLSGVASMSPRIATLIIESYHRNPKTPLTNRETDVLQSLATGKTYDYIAKELNMSKDTVKTHIRHIYDKLQVNNKSEALIKARKDNLV